MSDRHEVGVLLVGGHESDNGADLVPIAQAFQEEMAGQGYLVMATAPGRFLHVRAERLLDQCERVVVVPMTYGRNPNMVADAAKTLKWLARKAPDRLALSEPFSDVGLLGAWLRTTANEVAKANPDAVLLVAAPVSNPFDEAELHRVVYLVKTHGGLEVAVPVIGQVEEINRVADEQALLGRPKSALVFAGFTADAPEGLAEGIIFAGPLMAQGGISRILKGRVEEALHLLSHGESGIESGLMADHDHGYAHSHAFEESQGHEHPHSHTHSHPHTHTHTHGHHHH
ncbi:hypothetical protein [Scrofimicrobium sp. R131]|uniref:Cobalamin biosynthesis protein CbiX n=1 Tax=Scrofimicrobium appendicitidis TaxID=3079930 RepID=A0AAU7V5P2_9ACTO